ncbi:acyl-CoA thioesterase [Mesorhizobium qingshengii]|uniref:(3S)-malyl-CoA thioesterase n=1 Tax=Mesorhizobium qingshengii TaxID=1165689 RepID=A0A1G5XXS8_9HYPH|nr:acyl-CoA thioesterase [Mesorhizobium qingshengii]SDA75243.1 (3S)-malyl-CoA thioesterase [Mesorhizobium qingshengii]
MSKSLVTFVGVAHPWMCDVMGHMNVRYYAAMFDDASFQLLGHIAGQDGNQPSQTGWADVRTEIDYRHETKAGSLITIRSHVVKIGRTSVTFEQVMTGSLDGIVHASSRTTCVRFDLTARASVALDEPMRKRAAAFLIEQPEVSAGQPL